MIRCCCCGILVIPIGEMEYGFMTCPGCKEEVFAITSNGRSYKKSEVTVDHENTTITIKPENEIPQKAD